MPGSRLHTINNARLVGKTGLWQLTLRDGRIQAIEPQPAGQQHDALDAEGGLVIAPFAEPHIHLDTTQTAGEPAWN